MLIHSPAATITQGHTVLEVLVNTQKTIDMHPFGGTPICPRCNKAVYLAEQVRSQSQQTVTDPDRVLTISRRLWGQGERCEGLNITSVPKVLILSFPTVIPQGNIKFSLEAIRY